MVKQGNYYKQQFEKGHNQMNSAFRKLKDMDRALPKWASVWAQFELAIEMMGGKRENAREIFDNLISRR